MKSFSSSKFPIGTVERETGLSKDTLRVWEKRYGFPTPSRDDQGDRVYVSEQVEQLQLVKRLIDSGLRPGKIIHLTVDELKERLRQSSGPIARSKTDGLVALLKKGSPATVDRYLRTQLVARGLASFVTDLLPKLNESVGNAWVSQSITIAEEHLYTELVQNMLRQTLQQFPVTGEERPRVILTTLPGEQHTLGLLMAQTMLTLAGSDVRSFGIQMPLHEIVFAARHHQADIVALSFSASYPLTAAVEDLTSLRSMLPSDCTIWVGGAGLNHLRQVPEGICHLAHLGEIKPAIETWHEMRG